MHFMYNELHFMQENKIYCVVQFWRNNNCKDKEFFTKNAKSWDGNSSHRNWTRLPLQYAYLHNVIFLCTKFHQNPPKGLRKVEKINYKRPMGHITQLRNLGPYRNIFPISNRHFISICPIWPSGAMILTNLLSF
jgi:hypothetical protein